MLREYAGAAILATYDQIGSGSGGGGVVAERVTLSASVYFIALVIRLSITCTSRWRSDIIRAGTSGATAAVTATPVFASSFTMVCTSVKQPRMSTSSILHGVAHSWLKRLKNIIEKNKSEQFITFDAASFHFIAAFKTRDGFNEYNRWGIVSLASMASTPP